MVGRRSLASPIFGKLAFIVVGECITHSFYLYLQAHFTKRPSFKNVKKTSGQIMILYFTNPDFPERREFPLLNHLIGWGRVRSRANFPRGMVCKSLTVSQGLVKFTHSFSPSFASWWIQIPISLLTIHASLRCQCFHPWNFHWMEYVVVMVQKSSYSNHLGWC